MSDINKIVYEEFENTQKALQYGSDFLKRNNDVDKLNFKERNKRLKNEILHLLSLSKREKNNV